MPRLSKPLAALTADDLTAMLAEKWPEDEQLEFKQALPANSPQGDRWITHGDTVGERAKRIVFAEVVAFANTYGGDVVLGIQESDDNPRCAEKRTPLPRCTDLAEQLSMIARGVIDPQVPRLEIRGIPIDESGEGYVVIRVPQSRLGPHRLTLDKECYRRRGGSSEAMTMREIQDLTFATARGLHAVEMRLLEFRQKFESWHAAGHRRMGQSFAYRVTAVPVSSSLVIDPVHNVAEVRPKLESRIASVHGKRYELHTLLHEHPNWRPMLRGTQASIGDSKRAANWGLIQLLSDGTVNYQVAHTAEVPATATENKLGPEEFGLYPGWMLWSVVNALDVVDRVRAYTSAESVDFALELQIQTEAALPVIRVHFEGGWDVGGTLGQGTHLFPRYVVGGKDSRAQLLNLIWRDMWNQIGIEAYDRDEFKLVD